MATRVFSLRPFPQRLLRSLLGFAAAGTIMAAVVWSDGMGAPWLPLAILIACWAIPAAFAWQVTRQGYDPLKALEVSEEGLRAVYRDGESRFVPWAGISRLVQVEGFRYKAWAVVAAPQSVRWYGELEAPEALQDALAERTGLNWEVESRLPKEAL